MMKKIINILTCSVCLALIFFDNCYSQSIVVGMDIPRGDLKEYGKMFAWGMRLPLKKRQIPASLELSLSGKWYSRDELSFEIDQTNLNSDEILTPESKYILAGAEASMQFKVMNQYGQLITTYTGFGGGLFYRYLKEEIPDLPVFRKRGTVSSFLAYFGVRVNLTSYYNIDLRFEIRHINEGRVPDVSASDSAGYFIMITPDYRIYTVTANLNFITQIKQVF